LLGWAFLFPALSLSLLAQNGPEMDMERAAAVISWPATNDDYIVLSSATVDGTYYPCLDPIARGPGVLQMAVRTTDHSQYFKLAQGQWFMDDFDDGNFEAWSVTYDVPDLETNIAVEPANGALRIHGTCAECDRRLVVFYRTKLMMADCALSIDILAWDESVIGDRPGVGFVTRLAGPSVAESPRYSAGISMESGSYPGRAALYIMEYTENGSHYLSGPAPFPKIDPVRDYRLVFYCVGPILTLQLFDLAEGTLVKQIQAIDSTLTDGWVALWVSENGPSGTLDFTVDNFVAVGTSP